MANIAEFYKKIKVLGDYNCTFSALVFPMLFQRVARGVANSFYLTEPVKAIFFYAPLRDACPNPLFVVVCRHLKLLMELLCAPTCVVSLINLPARKSP